MGDKLSVNTQWTKQGLTSHLETKVEAGSQPVEVSAYLKELYDTVKEVGSNEKLENKVKYQLASYTWFMNLSALVVSEKK